MARVFAAILFMFCLSIYLSAQQKSSYNPVVENLVEEILSSSAFQADLSEIVDDLEYYFENPLNINSATSEELQSLWVLSDFQIKSLLNYINAGGDIVTVYELAYIDGFNIAVVKTLIPFITVEPVVDKPEVKPSDFFRYAKHNTYIKATSVVEDQLGYLPKYDTADSRYLGNRLSLMSRYQMSYKKQMYFGFVTEKDAGEEFFAGSNRNGFDFYSAHFQIKDLGLVKNVVLGDYSVQFGQGLVLWSAFSTGKSMYVMNACKNGTGLKKYSSTNENLFMRGAGVTVGTDKVELTAFASYKPIDANLQKDTLTGNDYFSSYQGAGLHAEESTVQGKDAVMETIAGANLGFSHSFFSIGATAMANRFSNKLMKQDNPKNVFAFKGTENYNIGSDFELKFSGLHMFGEAAFSRSGGRAFLLGSLLKLHENFNASFLYRDYAKDYHALYAGGFGEASGTTNEKGFYVGTDINPFRGWKLTAYYDFFRFPWLRTGADSPSEGYEYFVQAAFVASRNVDMVFRYRSKTKEVNSGMAAKIPDLAETGLQSVRYHINSRLSEKIELRNRVEYSIYSCEEIHENGILIYQDVICSPFRFPLSFHFRYAYFDTDSYNTRIYAYESDILHSFSVLPYYHNGTRTYLMLKYSIENRVSFWLKYAKTWYAEKQIIGSGLNQIDGSTKTDIKFMVRLTF